MIVGMVYMSNDIFTKKRHGDYEIVCVTLAEGRPSEPRDLRKVAFICKHINRLGFKLESIFISLACPLKVAWGTPYGTLPYLGVCSIYPRGYTNHCTS
jgi:hypothetical protein